MKESLDKLIKRLILRKYPFVEDYEIKVSTLKLGIGNPKKITSETYTVAYTVTPDEDGTFTVTDDLRRIEELTETLFKMLGPMNYQRFGGVEFYTNED
jgi:hypothetical protein